MFIVHDPRFWARHSRSMVQLQVCLTIAGVAMSSLSMPAEELAALKAALAAAEERARCRQTAAAEAEAGSAALRQQLAAAQQAARTGDGRVRQAEARAAVAEEALLQVCSGCAIPEKVVNLGCRSTILFQDAVCGFIACIRAL
jgi:hypothetical protein